MTHKVVNILVYYIHTEKVFMHFSMHKNKKFIIIIMIMMKTLYSYDEPKHTFGHRMYLYTLYIVFFVVVAMNKPKRFRIQ